MRSSVKYFFALIVSIYLLSNIGIPVYYHYCGGELESVNAIFKNTNCCGEEEEEDSDCCQNETKILSQKSETPFSVSHYKITPGIQDLDFLHQAVILSTNALSFVSINSNSFKFHPPESGRRVLSVKSVLII